jgi:Zn-dependent alcohol dehydrogenase
MMKARAAVLFEGLKLDELLTRTYPLEKINEAYEALERGEVARSVVLF